jgi:ubiquinone/menaquinone biosynthesis C-methylase UbiE
LVIDADPTGEPIPARGDAVCGSCGAHHPIRAHVLDMTQRGDLKMLTPAGWSNYFHLVPWIYENVWRPRSLAILSGERFSTAREVNMLTDWLSLPSEELVVDLGSSTDLYARSLAKRSGSITIFSIDLALGMLQAGRAYALRDGLKNIAHVRAPAQHLPFGDGTVDAIVCGGSLNEFRDITVALREARRVCKTDGKMFAMSLLEADSAVGRLGQLGARTSGIQFPLFGKFNAMVDAAGWLRERQEVFGMVAFTLMRPRIEE